MPLLCHTGKHDGFCDACAMHHATLLSSTPLSVWIGFVWQSAVLRFEYKRKGNRIIVCFLSLSASPQRVDFAISKYERAGKMPPGNYRYLQLGLE